MKHPPIAQIAQISYLNSFALRIGGIGVICGRFRFNIGLGDIVENLEIYPPIARETVTVEGVVLYSDGKPAVDEFVFFKSVKKQSAG